MQDADRPDSLGSLRVDKSTLHDQVANRIRDLIIEGTLQPGSRIDESALILRLGVSRTPFREALRTLAAEGLVEIRQGRGAAVRKLSAEDVRSMLEVLANLERQAAQLTCERATDDEIAAMLDIHNRMLAFYEARDRMPYYRLNQEFHSGLARLSRNATLMELHGNLQARLKRIRFMGHRQPDYWAAAVAEHDEMAEALARRDGEALGEVVARHIMRAWKRVEAVL